MSDTITIGGTEYEVIRRFPGPPPAFTHDDTPDEVAIVRLPDTDGGVMVCGRFTRYAWHDPEKWHANVGERGAVRVLLAENNELRATIARIRDLCQPHASPASNTGAHRLACEVVKLIGGNSGDDDGD